MTIAALYVVAQSVAAGSLLEALVGIPYWVAVLITGAAILTYVILGGMLATTWVQIVKTSLLLIGVATMAIWVLAKFGFDPVRLLNARGGQVGQGRAPTAAPDCCSPTGWMRSPPPSPSCSARSGCRTS